MEWLDNWGKDTVLSQLSVCNQHVAVIKAMLARPVMPEEPTQEVADLMWRAATNCGQSGTLYMLAAYRALYAHLTRPKTKEVEVWHVEYANTLQMAALALRDNKILADDEANRLHCMGMTCIRVTGPHKQTVPA